MAQVHNEVCVRKKEEKKEENEQSKREIHPVPLAFYFITFILLSSMEYICLKDQSATYPLQGSSLGISFFTFITVSCLMAKSKTEIICLYFLIDNILFAFMMGAIGIVGFAYVANKQYDGLIDLTSIYVASAIAVIVIFMGIGTFRILILNGKWKKYQIVLMKLSLLISSLMYTVLAFDLIVNDWASNALKDFIFLYLFGMVATLLELYGKLTDVDGTSEMRYDYSMKKQKDEEEQKFAERGEENIQIDETIHPSKMVHKIEPPGTENAFHA